MKIGDERIDFSDCARFVFERGVSWHRMTCFYRTGLETVDELVNNETAMKRQGCRREICCELSCTFRTKPCERVIGRAKGTAS